MISERSAAVENHDDVYGVWWAAERGVCVLYYSTYGRTGGGATSVRKTSPPRRESRVTRRRKEKERPLQDHRCARRGMPIADADPACNPRRIKTSAQVSQKFTWLMPRARRLPRGSIGRGVGTRSRARTSCMSSRLQLARLHAPRRPSSCCSPAIIEPFRTPAARGRPSRMAPTDAT